MIHLWQSSKNGYMSGTAPAGARILIIDDDVDLLLLLVRMLERIDTIPVCVETGQEGLDLLAHDRFDLVILDLMLPGLDGIEVLKRLRADLRHEKTPVLILSSRADPGMISKGLETGADGYLTKPFLPNTLTSRVRALLVQGRSSEPA